MRSESAATHRHGHRAVPRLANLLAILLIRAYQRTMSRRLAEQGFRCAHFPTCSDYGVLAFQKYGFVTASQMTLARVRECGHELARPVVDPP